MELFTALLAILAGGLLYYFFSRKAGYFERLGIPYEPPVPILGNMTRCVFRRVSIPDYINELYIKFSGTKYFGIFNFVDPIIVVRDPELIQNICVKHFEHFMDHPGLVDEKTDPLVGKNLFSLRGDTWREMRKVLSPAFTSSKMKMMHELIIQCAENFVDCLSTQSKDGKDTDIKDIFNRYATDVVGTCAFGINVDSMRNPQNEFYLLAKETMNFDSGLSFKLFLGENYVMISKFLGLKMFSERVSNFFYSLVRDTVSTRDEKGIVRPDMIQLMMESRGKDTELTFEEMTSQAFVFFLGGFDTTSSAMCFVAHEVGVNPQVQSKLREEIDEVVRRTNGKPTYEAIKQMKYLDAVFNETLRLYPLAHSLNRTCVKEYELPPATPGGKPVTVTPGMTVWLTSYSIQRDPNFYSDPNKFNPERFLNGSVNTSYYMPFGVGPRQCIGNRFAIMETKILIFYLLWRCELSACKKTLVPMRFSKKSFVMSGEKGFWLKVRPRSDLHSKISNGNGIANDVGVAK